MTITVPPELEISINAAVRSGFFASVDDAMTEAARLLLQQLHQKRTSPQQSEASEGAAIPPYKPIWERILERAATIPDEEFDKLPIDGASQHDHYIYGAPKRPRAQ